jgi:MFS family permease
MIRITWLQRQLAQSNALPMSLFGALAAFLVYSSMYAFRKPFAVATFEGQSLLGLDYKVWLILAQTLGYMASKFYGIKAISELSDTRRASLILGLISLSWLALLGFALLPAPLGIACFVVNGFPLGLIWGIVFHYLEGRRFTELMGSVLAASFVFSSGFVKSVGQFVLTRWDVSEQWMPFVTGLLFFPLLALSIFLLNHLPPPSEEDRELRAPRPPMSQAARRAFFSAFRPGLVALVLVYMMLTALRDLRDNFVVEIWQGLNIEADPALLTQTETPIAVLLLAMMALMVLVRDNRRAFLLNHAIILGGFAVSVGATLAMLAGVLGAVPWMILVGAGVYMAYIPFNTLLFERLIATFRYAGNVGFLMYLVDSFGYLGSVSLLLLRQFGNLDHISWLDFYVRALLLFLGIASVLMLLSLVYFRAKMRADRRATVPQPST